jgi:hypothetical protein
MLGEKERERERERIGWVCVSSLGMLGYRERVGRGMEG